MFANRMLVASTILVVLLTTVNAFTIQIKDYECQDKAIKADFTDICDNNMTCSFGQTAYISGVLNMTNDGSISSDTMVYLDSRLHIATYQTSLLKMQPIYLCNQYMTDYEGRRELAQSSYGTYGDEYETNNNSNSNGGQQEAQQTSYNYGGYSSGSSSGCPHSGLYSFDNVALQLPTVPNKVYDWVATGWTGSISVDMYLDSSKYQLIGRCQLNVVTHMDDSYSNSTSTNSLVNTVMSAIPEAGVTGMIILGTFAACAFLGIVGYAMSNADNNGDDMDFKPMKHHVEVA
ncbi:unnamed protein product [Cylindrotheca closterium]|uniref:Uncharacterized protein n=1 Tax=Cylindrotheca closterium TaxID=2856 RepID=A0AAD2FZ86_9STRA|nr:unnamed protein product [Cylindrotheca closterium]